MRGSDSDRRQAEKGLVSPNLVYSHTKLSMINGMCQIKGEVVRALLLGAHEEMKKGGAGDGSAF
jgi:hypothetical protein